MVDTVYDMTGCASHGCDLTVVEGYDYIWVKHVNLGVTRTRLFTRDELTRVNINEMLNWVGRIHASERRWLAQAVHYTLAGVTTGRFSVGRN